MPSIPIACTLSDASLAKRVADLEQDLFAQSLGVESVPGGIRHTFAASDEIKRELFDFIEAETTCCAFLTFRLTFEPGHGPIALEITGPEEARQLIEETFAGR